jgi:hypothetical protein
MPSGYKKLRLGQLTHQWLKSNMKEQNLNKLSPLLMMAYQAEKNVILPKGK